MKEPNKITGANVGGRRQLPMRTRWAARVAQFCRSALIRIAKTQVPTMSLAELEKEITKLSPGELGALTRWLDDYAARAWDEQLERDIAAGKLDHLAEQADADFKAGRCTEL